MAGPTGTSGAFRLIPDPNPALPILAGELVTAWCPNATPKCEHCDDFGQAIAPEESNQLVVDCPHCGGGTPDWNEQEDGQPDTAEFFAD